MALRRAYWKIAGSIRKRRRELAVPRNGKVLRCAIAYNRYGAYCVPSSSSHRPAARTILSGRVWEADTIGLLCEAARHGDIVHAGTYFGDFLPPLAAACEETGGKVWAFEPSRENYRCAEITTLLNDLSNVVLRRAALGAVVGKARLVTSTNDGEHLGGGSFVVGAGIEGKDAGVVEEVPVESLDGLVDAGRKIAAIHLDVEGFEQQALEGALATIERFRPLLVLESLPPDRWMERNLCTLGYSVTGRVDGNFVLTVRK